MDLNMPQMNAFECLKKIRNSSKLKNQVMILYSTSSEQKDIDTTFAAGVNSYLTKPNTYLQIKKLLQESILANV